MFQLIIGAIAVVFLAMMWREYRRQSSLRNAQQDYEDAKAEKLIRTIKEKTNNLKKEK